MSSAELMNMPIVSRDPGEPVRQVFVDSCELRSSGVKVERYINNAARNHS